MQTCRVALRKRLCDAHIRGAVCRAGCLVSLQGHMHRCSRLHVHGLHAARLRGQHVQVPERLHGQDIAIT